MEKKVVDKAKGVLGDGTMRNDYNTWEWLVIVDICMFLKFVELGR